MFEPWIQPESLHTRAATHAVQKRGQAFGLGLSLRKSREESRAMRSSRVFLNSFDLFVW